MFGTAPLRENSLTALSFADPNSIAIVTKAICETTSVRRYWLEPTKVWALVQSTSGFINSLCNWSVSVRFTYPFKAAAVNITINFTINAFCWQPSWNKRNSKSTHLVAAANRGSLSSWIIHAFIMYNSCKDLRTTWTNSSEEKPGSCCRSGSAIQNTT